VPPGSAPPNYRQQVDLRCREITGAVAKGVGGRAGGLLARALASDRKRAIASISAASSQADADAAVAAFQRVADAHVLQSK
jgi:hypothetical protein